MHSAADLVGKKKCAHCAAKRGGWCRRSSSLQQSLCKPCSRCPRPYPACTAGVRCRTGQCRPGALASCRSHSNCLLELTLSALLASQARDGGAGGCRAGALHWRQQLQPQAGEHCNPRSEGRRRQMLSVGPRCPCCFYQRCTASGSWLELTCTRCWPSFVLSSTLRICWLLPAHQAGGEPDPLRTASTL